MHAAAPVLRMARWVAMSAEREALAGQTVVVDCAG